MYDTVKAKKGCVFNSGSKKINKSNLLTIDQLKIFIKQHILIDAWGNMPNSSRDDKATWNVPNL